MSALPVAVHGAAEVRAMDRHAIETLGVPGYTLMCRAGEAALDLLLQAWPSAQRVLVACGAGNNGGDGYVLARLAQAAGLEVTVAALAEPARLTGDAARACADYRAAGGVPRQFAPELAAASDVIVDALLGTGIDRDVGGELRTCIESLNASGRPVLALDLPSGLHADDGRVLGCAVRATRTLTFVGLKTGLFLGAAPVQVGVLSFAGLGIDGVTNPPPPRLRRIDAGLLAHVLPRRARDAHKGQHGRVLIVGGGPGMPGAVRLAAEASLRAGAGLVTVATRPEHTTAIVAGRPEIICRGIEAAVELEPLLAGADVVAVGPGLGQSDWARALFAATLAAECPLIVDADALNLLASMPRRRERWVLTPHPGEAARLLGVLPAAIQADRLAAAHELASRFGGVVVLKGANSLVVRDGAIPWVCDRGNAGMATAGMGDVLTGAIAALVGQCGELELGAAAAVLAHATAGDRAAALGGERGLLASDLLAELRACLNPA
jgi:ADP-dependent NAD(P)H-hydrate dehydratase / NAD(P)H-hydrate epimerase